MRRSSAIALSLLMAAPLAAQTPTAATLRADFDAANAAARSALARLKMQAIAKPLTQQQKLGVAAHAAGVDKPCDRTLFNVEGAASNFRIQPGQLILLTGCFKGASNAEVRISGTFFPPYGYLLLSIQERADTYFYGAVPDVTGVPDQPVAISIRFLSDGFTTAPKNGLFYRKNHWAME